MLAATSRNLLSKQLNLQQVSATANYTLFKKGILFQIENLTPAMIIMLCLILEMQGSIWVKSSKRQAQISHTHKYNNYVCSDTRSKYQVLL